jgi:hypothetical protein
MTYVLNELNGKRASTDTFATKIEAKIARNRLLDQGIVCVVSRGADHPNGASRPDPRCRNIERTSMSKRRRKRESAA